MDTETDTRESEGAQARSGGPFGGLSPAEAARRRAAVQRERKAASEAAAEFDRLTVSQRVATSQAQTLTYQDLVDLHETLKLAAKGGSLHAIRELRAWLQLGLSIPDDGTLDVDAPLASLNPAQRAALTARLVRDVYGKGEGSDPA